MSGRDVRAKGMDPLPPVIGHRGAAGLAPENTLSALRAAASAGARWVEFDVRLTADGHPILFHDDTLDRTTDATGPVADCSLAEVREMDAGTWFSGAFRGERVPTLDEVFVVLEQYGLGANIEVKPDRDRQVETARIVVDRVRNAWPSELPAPVLSSFSADATSTIAAEAPELPLAMLVGGVPADWRLQMERFGCRALHCSAKHLRRDQMGTLRDAGFAVRCYTVNSPAEACRLFEWGVEAVFTDYPDRLVLEATLGPGPARGDRPPY